MDEKILLNRDEKREIWQRVHDVPATARMNGQPDWTPEYEAALCRAQLAKVVEWLKTHTEPFTDSELHEFFMEWDAEPFLKAGDRWIAESDWQALKAAGGEGK